MSQLGEALFTTTQRKVLGLLYGQPDKTFYVNEILRRTGMGVATIKRELERMTVAGILRMSKVGNQHHYQANPQCPIFGELAGLVRKTFGVHETIRSALLGLSDKIHWAFIFGSLASGKETSASDVDLMIIGEVSFSEVVGLLHPVEEQLGRQINPKVYSKTGWVRTSKAKEAFFRALLAKPRIDILGNENELG